MTSSRTLLSEPETAVCSSIPSCSDEDMLISPSSKRSPPAASAIARSSVDLPQPLPPSSAHLSLGLISQLTPRISGEEPAHTSKSRMEIAASEATAASMCGSGVRGPTSARGLKSATVGSKQAAAMEVVAATIAVIVSS